MLLKHIHYVHMGEISEVLIAYLNGMSEKDEGDQDIEVTTDYFYYSS